MVIESFQRFVADTTKGADRTTPLWANEPVTCPMYHECLDGEGSASSHNGACRSLRTECLVTEPGRHRVEIPWRIGIFDWQLLPRISVSTDSSRYAEHWGNRGEQRRKGSLPTGNVRVKRGR